MVEDPCREDRDLHRRNKTVAQLRVSDTAKLSQKKRVLAWMWIMFVSTLLKLFPLDYRHAESLIVNR